MESNDRIKKTALDVLPFLQESDDIFTEQFFQHGQYARIACGEYICMEGNQCSRLPVVLSGIARVYKIAENGREITLYRIVSGQSCILTASCILSDISFPAFAVAESDIEAIVVPNEFVSAWLKEYDNWKEYVFEMLAHRLSGVVELVEEIAFQKIDIRLADYLVRFAGSGEIVEKTHEAVAADLGTSREVISRILKDFEQEGLVELSRGEIRVCAPRNLTSRKK